MSEGNAALYTFLVYILVVFGLAWLANKLLRERSFLSEYFLGSRSLCIWAFALTFAATSASGGSFTGFPSKIYTHGWGGGGGLGESAAVSAGSYRLCGERIGRLFSGPDGFCALLATGYSSGVYGGDGGWISGTSGLVRGGGLGQW